MSTIVEDNNTQIDPGAEVRRLQELVQKLEHQNQLLRTKHSQPTSPETNDNRNVISANGKSNCDDNASAVLRTQNFGMDNLKDCFKRCSIGEEIVDVDNAIANDDDESWLFMSPKRPSPQSSISPYKWMRQEFEKPSPEVETVRRSLVYKLDEVARVGRSPSLGTLSSLSLSTAESPTSHSAPPPPQDYSPAQDAVPAIRKPLFAGGARVDTNTFTRPKKTRPAPSSALPSKPVSPRADLSTSPRADFSTSPRAELSSSPRGGSPRNTPERGLVERGPAERGPAERGPADTNGNTNGAEEREEYQPKLADVVDVQVLARMQEESLRQSLNASPKKSFKGSRSALAASYADLENHSSQSSNRSSPGRFDGEMYASTRRSSNSLASLSSHSNSPPDSPYGSQYLDHKPQGSASRSSAASPGRTLSPAGRRAAGIPRPSTGIPRPGSSRLPAPRGAKSGLRSPATRRSARPADDSWKDGCF